MWMDRTSLGCILWKVKISLFRNVLGVYICVCNYVSREILPLSLIIPSLIDLYHFIVSYL